MGNSPPEDTLSQELVDAVCNGSDVLDADIEVHVKDGKLMMVAVLFLAGAPVTEGSTSFSHAGKSADILRLRLRTTAWSYSKRSARPLDARRWECWPAHRQIQLRRPHAQRGGYAMTQFKTIN